MRCVTLCICVLLSSIGASWAAENVAAEKPVVSVDVPDFERTRQRFAQSVYSVIWNHPMMEKARAELERESQRAEERGRPSPLKILQSLKQSHFTLLGFSSESNEPKLRLQFDVAAYADVIWQYMAEKGEAVPAPAGADAAFLKDDGKERAARFGETIILSALADPVKVDIASSDADFVAQAQIIDLFDMLKGLPGVDEQSITQAQDALMTNEIEGSVRIQENGILELLTMDYTGDPIPGAVDLSIFNALPKECLLVGAVQSNSAFMQAQFEKAGMKTDPAVQQVDRMLAPLGITYLELLSSFDGTIAMAITPAAPFPALSIFIPRSEKLDQFIGNLLTQIQVPVPADGTPTALPIPNMPILVQLGKNDSHWVLSSDAMHMQGMLTKAEASFGDGPLAELLKQQAGEQCWAIGAYDTQKILTLIMQYMAFIPDPQIKMQLGDLIMKLQQRVGPGYMVFNQVDKGFTYRAEGLFGGYFSTIPVIAAIAIPNLMESRVSANEAAAAATLKAAVFAAQIQFQAGGYNDADSNGVGRFGFIDEMSGNVAVTGANVGDLGLIQGPLALPNEPAQASGYYFKVYLPHGEGRAFKNGKEIRNAQLKSEVHMERKFIVYAWPISEESGRKIFAMTEDGQLVVPNNRYKFEYDAVNLPPWNLIWGVDGKWGDTLKDWKYYTR